MIGRLHDTSITTRLYCVMGGLCDVLIFIYSTYTMWAAKARGWGGYFLLSSAGFVRCSYKGFVCTREDYARDALMLIMIGDDGETMTTVYL